jgi:hypothetical protein
MLKNIRNIRALIALIQFKKLYHMKSGQSLTETECDLIITE